MSSNGLMAEILREVAAIDALRCCTLMSMEIEGMRCQGCAEAIQCALLGLDGVLRAEVSLRGHAAAIVYDPLNTCSHMLVEVVESASFGEHGGYHASLGRSRSVRGALKAQQLKPIRRSS